MNEQLKHYQDKLNYEIDSWDLNKAIKSDDAVVVIDARSREILSQKLDSVERG